MKTLKLLLIQFLLVLFSSTSFSQVTTFPYHESFETGFGVWQQYVGDNFDWTRFQGATPSFLTGPNAAYDGNWYVYTEADGHQMAHSILYAVFNFQAAGVTNPRITFFYHMYNGLVFPPFIPDQMGTLQVVVSTNGGATFQTVWERSGNQGNAWYSAFVNLSTYGSMNNVYIGFRSFIGSGNRSDIAVDEVNVYQPELNCIAMPYPQNFNASSSLPSLWTRDNPNTWGISTAWNGSTPPTGNHLNSLIRAKTYGTVYAPCFDAYSNFDIHVRFFHYWRRAAGLAAYQNGKFYGSPDGGVTVYLIDQWTSAITTEEGWQEYDVSSWADGASKLMFWWEISGGYTFFGTNGRWQLDDFEVKEGPWSGIYTWTGAVSTDWNTAGNWNSGAIPNVGITAIIPAGAPRFPEISGVLDVGANYGAPTCKSLSIESGAQVTVSGWGQLSLFGKAFVKNNANLYVKRLNVGWNGELYVLGGNVRVDIVSNFTEGTGYMNNGNFTTADLNYTNSGWYASGGTVISDATTTAEVSFNVVGSLNINNYEVANDTKVNYSGLTNVSGNFTINPKSKFNLSSGTLNVTGNTYIKADITGMGQFIDYGTFTTGNANVEEYLISERWHYVSSPINNAQIGVFLDTYLREFHETTNTWTYLSLPTTLPMNVTKGYSAWAEDEMTGTTTVNFSGNLNLGVDFPLTSLSYTASSSGAGWNFLGNPYPAPLQWNNSWTKNNIGDWACIRENDHDECYNAATQTGWPNAGDMPNGIIPSTQGFFVKATSADASLTIPQSQRVFSDQPFYKNASIAVKESVRLRIDGNNDYDAALIQFIPSATEGFDPNLDLEKRWGYEEAPQLYCIAGDHDAFSVNALPELKTGMIVPLGLKVGASNTYTITATQIENLNPNITVVLEDKLENTFTELAEDTKYSFSANPGDETHRFNIHFKDTSLSGDDNLAPEIRIYSDRDIVYIQNPGKSACSIIIHNLMGQEIIGTQNQGESLTKLRVTTGTGYYVVRVLTFSNTYTEKIFIK